MSNADEDKVAMVDSDDDHTEIRTDNAASEETKTFDTPAPPPAGAGTGAGSGSGSSSAASLFAKVKEKAKEKAAAQATPTVTTSATDTSDLRDKAVKATASKEDKKEDKKDEKKKAQSSGGSKSRNKADDIRRQLLIRRSDAELVQASLADQTGDLWWRADAEQPLQDAAAVFVTGRSAVSVPKDINLRNVSLNLSQKQIDAQSNKGGDPIVTCKGKLAKEHYGDLIPLVAGKPDLTAMRHSFVFGGTDMHLGRVIRNKAEMTWGLISSSMWETVFESKNIDAKTGQTMIPDEYVFDKCGLKDDKRLRAELSVKLLHQKKAQKKTKKAGDEDDADAETEDVVPKAESKGAGKGSKRKAEGEAEDAPSPKKAKKAENGKEAKKAENGKTENGKEAKKAKADETDSDEEMSEEASKAVKKAKKELGLLRLLVRSSTEARDNAIARQRSVLGNKGVPAAVAKRVLRDMDETDD